MVRTGDGCEHPSYVLGSERLIGHWVLRHSSFQLQLSIRGRSRGQLGGFKAPGEMNIPRQKQRKTNVNEEDRR